MPPKSATYVNKEQLQALQRSMPKRDLSKTNVNLVREQVGLILNMRAVSGTNPPTADQLKILDERTTYLRESFPTLYKAALEERQLGTFHQHLNELLNLIEKTQNKELDYDEMTKQVGQTMFDRYVKPQV